MIISIILAYSSVFMINIKFIEENNNNGSDYNNNLILDNKRLKVSAISGNIHINNNWTDAKGVGICTGNGTYSNPYSIKDLVIDTEDLESGIRIENSTVYFKIENCTITGTYTRGGIISFDISYGIMLLSVSNGSLINNNVSNNTGYGIWLSNSINNTILGNTASNNIYDGIKLDFSHHNIISENTANFNVRGITLINSDFNTISGNTLRLNEICIVEEYCEGNIFKNNDCGDPGMVIPSYNPIFLLGILSAVTIILIKKIKKF